MSIDALYGSAPVFKPASARRREWTAVQSLVVFLVFLLVSIIPLLTHPLPPLEDYANHVSRMHVMADQGHNPVPGQVLRDRLGAAAQPDDGPDRAVSWRGS